ncbi:hypothetical protein LRR80_01723 [Streptomyces sp. RO-S4]|nr:hypothetical protein [Streptomyces sp. RO-S4]
MMARYTTATEQQMAQPMNGPQRTAVWLKALGVVAVVALAAIGAWTALHRADPPPTNACHGQAVCGQDNDDNHVGGEPAAKQ